EALLAELSGAVAGEPGALPVLQFTLAELWTRRDGDRITRAALDQIGGVDGALARPADAVVAAPRPGQRRHAPRLPPQPVGARRARRARPRPPADRARVRRRRRVRAGPRGAHDPLGGAARLARRRRRPPRDPGPRPRRRPRVAAPRALARRPVAAPPARRAR